MTLVLLLVMIALFFGGRELYFRYIGSTLLKVSQKIEELCIQNKFDEAHTLLEPYDKFLYRQFYISQTKEINRKKNFEAELASIRNRKY